MTFKSKHRLSLLVAIAWGYPKPLLAHVFIMWSMLGNQFKILMLGCFFCIAVCADEPPDLISGEVSSTEAMKLLHDGEIFVENVNTSSSGGSVRVQAMIFGDMQVMWDFIASCESNFLYVDGLRSCVILSVRTDSDSDTTTLSQSVKKSWVIPRMDFVINVRRQPLSRIDFELVEGDLAVMNGGWRFLQLKNEEAFILTHEIRVKPSFPVPRWLIRRSMRKDLPDMLACLRGLVDGSVQVSRLDDLNRCPNKDWKENYP